MTLLKLTLALVIYAVTSLSVFAHNDKRYSETVEKTFLVDKNALLRIENTNGKVEIEAWDKDEIVVTAKIYTEDKEGRDRVKVIITQQNNRLDISTEFKNQFSWGKQSYSQVDYFITVPTHTSLDDTILTNGSLSIKGVKGEINASLTNGKLVATGLASNTRVESINGSVSLSYDSNLTDLANIGVDSNNGSISLAFPEKMNAEIKAKSSNGSIYNDFGLEVSKHRSNARTLSGELGSGKVKINLYSNNGAIRIKKQTKEQI